MKWTTLLTLCFLIVLVSLVSPPLRAQSPEFDTLRQKLELLGITPTRIEGSEGSQILVAYEQPASESQRSVLFHALAVMMAEVEAFPQSPQAAVSISYAGQPLVQTVARSADVRAVLSNQLEADAFFDRLTFSAEEVPEALADRGLDVSGSWHPELALDGNKLNVVFSQPAVEPPGTLAAEWIQIFGWVANRFPGLSQATLDASFRDGTRIVVTATLSDLVGYQSGKISLAKLLLRLDLSAIPSISQAGAPPTSGTPLPVTPGPAQPLSEPVPPAIQQEAATSDLVIPTLPLPPVQLPTDAGGAAPGPVSSVPSSDTTAPLPPQLVNPPLVLVQPTLPPPPTALPAATQIVLPPERPAVEQPAPVAPPSIGPGRIAFASDFEGDYEIYTINPDGSDLVRLTNWSGEDWFPAWSPDGRRIAFQYMCAEHGVFHLCFMDSDGGNVDCLKPTVQGNPASVQRPGWSPDGGSFVFSLESTSQPTTVNIISTDGSVMTTLSTGRDPSWSPNAPLITFMDSGQIFTMNVDGSNKRQLTNNPGVCMYPTWSPNGARIAYSVEGQGIHIMNADGSGDQTVAPNSSWGLAWSPDGSELALGSGNTLTILYTDGTGVRSLVQGAQPSWSNVTAPAAAPLAGSPPVPDQSGSAQVQVQPSFGPLQFCAYFDDAGNPHDTRSDFPYGILEIHPYWSYSGVQPGTPYHTEWLDHSDGSSTSGDSVFDNTSGLQDRRLTRSGGTEPILAGNHTFRVEVGGQVVLSSEFTVSSSAAPLLPRVGTASQEPGPASASGLSGYIAYPVFKPGMSKPTYDIYVSKPDGSDRRLLWEWGRQPDIRSGDQPRCVEWRRTRQGQSVDGEHRRQ